jgi:hypothetical protein
MVNALHKYQGSVVENDNVLWSGRDNAGLTDMTHVNYSKDLTLFKLHFSNLNKKSVLGHAFAWNQSIKRCHLFNSCVVVATVHLHCFLRTVVKKRHQCLNCSSSMNERHKTYVSMACWRCLF